MRDRLLRLGTRRSALARAQSGAIARRLEQLHPGLAVELVGIDTRGDRILDQPLSQVEGKEFFTAEIDAALLRGQRRLHRAFVQGPEPGAARRHCCWPRCRSARIRATSSSVRGRRARSGSRRGAPLRIGSSSPRRAGIRAGVPASRRCRAARARVELCELRGNVDSRAAPPARAARLRRASSTAWFWRFAGPDATVAGDQSARWP